MDSIAALRKMSFPQCTQMALERMCTTFIQPLETNIPGLVSGDADDQAQQIAREFIFFETPNQSRALGRVTALKELQILDAILNIFHLGSRPPTVLHAVFRACFPASLAAPREHLLVKLVSVAVSTRCGALLDCAAAWMQRVGCHSDAAQQLASSVVHDHVHLLTGAPLAASTATTAGSGLLGLPSLSPHFTCNFITTLTQAYAPEGSSSGSAQPLPRPLLALLVAWLTDQPTVCLASLMGSTVQHSRSSLWTSPSKPNHQTPVPGLARWLTHADVLCHRRHHATTPVAMDTAENGEICDEVASRNGENTSRCGENGARNSEAISRTGESMESSCENSMVNGDTSARTHDHIMTNDDNTAKAGDGKDIETSVPLLWSQLHLALLQALVAFPSIPAANQLELFTLSDMSRIVNDAVALSKTVAGDDAVGKAACDTGMERLLQILQVAMATGGFRCSLSDLQRICDCVPASPLLRVLQSQHLARAPQPMHFESQ